MNPSINLAAGRIDHINEKPSGPSYVVGSVHDLNSRTVGIPRNAENDRITAAVVTARPLPTTYQSRVKPWLDACFGPQIAIDKVERNHRFLEEALELVQSTGISRREVLQLVHYVFDREVGEPDQEVGGVMNTLAALCLAHGLDMHEAGERELARVWRPEVLEKIRAKQKAKPKFSPLPQARRVRHLKRGTIYDIVFTGTAQCSTSAIADGDLVTAYRGEDGRVWFRKPEELDDPARFEGEA